MPQSNSSVRACTAHRACQHAAVAARAIRPAMCRSGSYLRVQRKQVDKCGVHGRCVVWLPSRLCGPGFVRSRRCHPSAPRSSFCSLCIGRCLLSRDALMCCRGTRCASRLPPCGMHFLRRGEVILSSADIHHLLGGVLGQLQRAPWSATALALHMCRLSSVQPRMPVATYRALSHRRAGGPAR